MEKKSIKLNMIINMIRSILSKIFPLITFPYVSRILLTDGVGQYQYTISFVSYFQIIAALGIFTYAVREGSKIRDDKTQINVFSNEILALNVITTIVSYILLFICVQYGNFQNYKIFIWIYSITILFQTFGVSWLFSIYEDFAYITIRSFIFQILSLVLLFVFVKEQSDVWVYMVITVVASVGSNIFNYLYSRKYVVLRPIQLKYFIGIKKHIRTILVMFGTNIASIIYLNIDTFMLGQMVSDSSVGLYSAAIKLNNVISCIITAVSDVMLPRLSYYLERGEKRNYEMLVTKVMKYYIFALVPIIVGCWFLTHNIITIFCGRAFYNAGFTMKIMLIDLLFALINGFIAYQICVPNGLEKKVLLATTVGAIVNLTTNFVMIPHLHENGAAITTVISEMSVFGILLIYSRKCINYKKIVDDMWQIVICSLVFIPIYLMSHNLFTSILVETFFTIIVGAIIYLALLLVMRNDTAYFFYNELACRVKRNRELK